MTRQGYRYNNYYDNKKKNKMLVEIQHVYAKAATEEINIEQVCIWIVYVDWCNNALSFRFSSSYLCFAMALPILRYQYE